MKYALPGTIISAILFLFTTLALSQTEGPKCTSTLDPGNPNAAYTCTVYKRGSAFDIPQDLPIFSPIDESHNESFYFDLNENRFQNEKIKKIYKNDKAENGPFDYCTDRYGCRLIRRGGDELLDRAERDSAIKEVDRIRGEYGKDKGEMAKAAEAAKGISSKDDVQGNMPKKIYEKKIAALTTEIKKDIPSLETKNAEVVKKNQDYENNVIPARKKVRTEKVASNEATVQLAQEDLRTQSSNLEPALSSMEGKVAGDIQSENALKIAASEAAYRSTDGLNSRFMRPSTYSNDPRSIENQFKTRSALYRMNGYSVQADRFAEMTTQLHNYNSGNTLPYQSMKLSPIAEEEYGDSAQGLSPQTFAGYSYIVLLNTVSSDIRTHPHINSDIKDYFRIMAKTVGSVGRSIGDDMQALETGWAVRDFATHFVGGTVKLVSSIGELVLTPVSDTADILALAIVNYEQTLTALVEGLPASYSRIKNCPDGRGSADCASILGEHALDVTGILTVGVRGLQQGASFVRAVSKATEAEVSYLGKLALAAETVGISSGMVFQDFAEWLRKPFDPNNLELGAIGPRQADEALEVIRGLRPESPPLLGVDLFEGVPKQYRGNVWDIMEALPAAVKGDAHATNFLSRFRPHPMERDPALRDYISLDLVPNNPSASPLRFLYKVQSDGTIKWMIKDTHI